METDCAGVSAQVQPYLQRLLQGRQAYVAPQPPGAFPPGTAPPAIWVHPGDGALPGALGNPDPPVGMYFYRPNEVLVAFADLAQFQTIAGGLGVIYQDESASYVRPSGEGYWTVQTNPAVVAEMAVHRLTVQLTGIAPADTVHNLCQDMQNKGVSATPNHVMFGCQHWDLSPFGDPSVGGSAQYVHGASGAGVTVVVADSGLPANYQQSPLLANHVMVPPNQPGQPSEFENYNWAPLAGAAPANLKYPQGHGAFVAGLVRLAAPAAAIHSYRFLDTPLTTDEWAFGNQLYPILAGLPRPLVLNLSLGVLTMVNPKTNLSESPLSLALLGRQAQPSNSRAPIVVAAAGNLGLDIAFFPAYDSWTISVGGAELNLVRGGPPQPTIACFSDYATVTANPSLWVDVCADAVDLTSCYPKQNYTNAAGAVLDFAQGWAQWSGTSFATPHVSGAVATMLSQVSGLAASGYQGVLQRITGNAANRVRGVTWGKNGDIGVFVP
jgi:subtilisin family serine protease